MQAFSKQFKPRTEYKASCHCKAVELALTFPDGLPELRHCTCSICRRRGVIVTSVTLDNLKVLKGEQHLTLYQFNTMAAKHYFCSICGVYTHHQRRSTPNEFSVNIGCLEGMENPFQFEPVRVLDGVNHSKDQQT